MRYISECSLSSIVSQLKSGELSPENLIDDLCDKLDKWDTKIKAFLPENYRRKRLHKELSELYDKFPQKENRPILFGIPIGVKDIFIVDGFETRAGSNLPPDLFEGEESEVVKILKNNGALILGKTVTTEFAYFHPGPTGNPYNINHTPGGSSSGSAAAVSAGFCPLAFGTQTIGSISRPASFCGVIGFKPSYNRISTNGVIPFSISADHVGFFTQDLKGIEITASLVVDNWDNSNVKSERKPILGIPEGKYLQQASNEILEAFQQAVKELENKGFIVKYIPLFDDIEIINEKHRDMNAAEFAKVHSNWKKQYEDKYHKASLELIQKGEKISEERLKEAIESRNIIRERVRKIQEENDIDLWLSPSAPTIAPKGLDSTGNPIMNLPWTFIGVPTISIPFGLVDQMPFGLQFAGKYNEDEKMLDFVNKVE